MQACQWKHRPGASCCVFFLFSCFHRRQRERSGTSSASSQSGNLSLPQTLLLGTTTKRKKRRYRRTPNSRSRQHVKICAQRKYSGCDDRWHAHEKCRQQHAGARQHDRGHTKVGSTSSSFNTIQTVEERAARAMSRRSGFWHNTTQSNQSPKVQLRSSA